MGVHERADVCGQLRVLLFATQPTSRDEILETAHPLTGLVQSLQNRFSSPPEASFGLAGAAFTARPIGRNQIGRLDRLRNMKRLRALQSCPVSQSFLKNKTFEVSSTVVAKSALAVIVVLPSGPCASRCTCSPTGVPIRRKGARSKSGAWPRNAKAVTDRCAWKRTSSINSTAVSGP